MKKEFASAERKAKAQYKASMTSSGLGEASSTNKKRKQSDSATDFNIIHANTTFGYSLSGGGAQAFPIPVQATSAQSKGTPAKKPKTQPVKPATQKMKTGLEISNTTSPKRPKQTTRCPALTKTWNESIAAGLPPPGPPPVGWHITPSGGLARDPGESSEMIKNRAKAKSEPEKKTAAKKGPAAKKKPTTTKEATPKKRTSVKKESAPEKEVNVKQELFSNSSPALSTSTSLGLVNGIYDISCPEISSEFGSRALTLTLTLDSPAVWGAYDFDMFSGVLLLPHRPTSASERELPLKWRGRENGEGQMSFGDHCRGEMRFLGGGRIQGWMSLYGDVEFTGTRRAGPGTPVRTAGSMRMEWDGYNYAAYEDERLGRWH